MTQPILPGAVETTIDIDGLPVWHGLRPGTGDAAPIVFLHGGLSDSRVFVGMLAEIDSDTGDHDQGAGSDTLTLAYYDRRGHGRTPDTRGPFGYSDMVREASRVLETVLGESRPVHLVGHSDGANLALCLALERPDLVASVTAFSGNVDPSGLKSQSVDVEGLVRYLESHDDGISPDGPGAVRSKVARIATLWTTEPTLTPDDLRRILCPVLVVCADGDEITLEHTIGLHRAIPGSSLAIVPAAGHMLVEDRPAEAARLALAHIARAR